MTANERNFGFISQMGIIQVPFFQRAYVWEEKHWTKLWNDLVDSYDHKYSHFLGSIILKSDVSTSCLLIDGQQRTTTFSLLLRVLGEQLNILEKSKVLNNCLFGQDKNYEDIPRIQHSRLDREVFRAIILGQSVDNQSSAIYQCYKFFSKKVSKYIAEHSKEQANSFLNKILTDKLFVLVDIAKDEDEQRIFDSINTSGQPLAGFDIVKNDVFSHFNDDNKAEKIYTEFWIPTFEKDNDVKEFWDEEVLTGREKKIRSDIFLHNFAIIAQIFDPSKETLSQMNEVYKEYIKNKDEDSIITFIKKFTEYAKVFQTLPFFQEAMEYEYTDTMKRFLHIIHVLQLSTLIPLALYLELTYQQGKISEKEYTDSLTLLEQYVIRRALKNLDTSGYNKIIYNLIVELSKSNSIYVTLEQNLSNLKSDTDRFPKSQEISELSFERFDTKLAKLILFWIELERRYKEREYGDSKEALQYNFQLEHLMPKAWGQYWTLPIIDKTPDQFNKELLSTNKISKSIYEMNSYEFIDQLNKSGYLGETINKDWLYRDQKIHELGNFTILSGKLNNSLKNYEWKRKLNGEGYKKGIRYYSGLILNRELCDKYGQEWTEDTITKRTQTLKKHIVEIW